MSTKQADESEDAAISKYDAVVLMKHMVRASISSICFSREIFPMSCFNTNDFLSFDIYQPVAKTGNSAAAAYTFRERVEEGVFKALEDEFLSVLVFAIYTKHPISGKEELLETYEYEFSYSDGSEVVVDALISKDAVKEQMTDLILSVTSFLATLNTREVEGAVKPASRWCSLHMKYTDRAPADYKPEFLPVSTIASGALLSYYIDIGSVSTNTLDLTVRYYGLKPASDLYHISRTGDGVNSLLCVDFVLERTREFLGTACDPQLRLVSRWCRDVLAPVPRALLRVDDFLTPVKLYVWARRQLGMPRGKGVAIKGARGGHLGMLQFLGKSKGGFWGGALCDAAAGGGHLHVLQWLRSRTPAVHWGPDGTRGAAEGGHLGSLQWMYAQRPKCPRVYDICLYAARGGHLHVLEWLRARDSFCLLASNACSQAAAHGHLEVLKWLRARGCSWSEDTCAAAATGGHMHILQWLRSQNPPCPWAGDTYAGAAKGGHLSILQWLRAQTPPCPWVPGIEPACTAAAENGHLEALQWLRSQTPPRPWDAEACHSAADNGQLEVLQWLRSQNPPCPWDAWTCALTAKGGHLHVLKWLRAQNPPCPLSDDAVYWAARIGNLEVLKWLRGQNPPCPWDAEASGEAATGGHLKVLKWLRAQSPPCPWDAYVCEMAVESESLRMLMWLRAQDPPCPWDEGALDSAMENGFGEIEEWLRDNNAPEPESDESGSEDS
mmetsp:Transcript_1335/g.3081  ORF Transcript_1335/g.3081 Transcript_1335/m.3081 type:complete len:722 (-) Transcript_1335:726-2891(-)